MLKNNGEGTEYVLQRTCRDFEFRYYAYLSNGFSWLKKGIHQSARGFSVQNNYLDIQKAQGLKITQNLRGHEPSTRITSYVEWNNVTLGWNAHFN